MLLRQGFQSICSNTLRSSDSKWACNSHFYLWPMFPCSKIRNQRQNLIRPLVRKSNLVGKRISVSLQSFTGLALIRAPFLTAADKIFSRKMKLRISCGMPPDLGPQKRLLKTIAVEKADNFKFISHVNGSDSYLSSLNPLYTNGFFLLVWYSKLGILHCTISRDFRL